MFTSDIYSLLGPAHEDPIYRDKYMHDIPRADVVDRLQFILQRCKGKRVLNFGSSSGNLHSYLSDVAAALYGVDKSGTPDFHLDLDDDHYSLLNLPQADVYLCGEVLEHLSAPGPFLRRLKLALVSDGAENAQAIITVPNAFSSMAQHHARTGIENVNADHVCWYSWRTMTTLLQRNHFVTREFYWYNGKPIFAEGMIFVVD